MKSNENSRTRNSIRNSLFGIGSQFVTLFLSFACRTVFIRLLGADYLGINGLYSNILSVLSLAELGVGNVLLYSLYRPIADHDKQKIAALLQYFKKIYHIIACSIFGAGLLLIPFLPYIVKSSLPYSKFLLYYLLFLTNSAVSYLVIYKSALINANQKLYIINIINTTFIIFQYLAQMAVLWISKNYVAYLVTQVCCTLFNNLTISFCANRLYPYLRVRKPPATNLLEEKSLLWSNISSTFLYKAGTVVMNSTDNLVISIILGTLVVGYYSNYSMIVAAVTTFIGIGIQSIFSSIGNLMAKEERDKALQLFHSLILLFQGIGTFCSLCFLLILSDFVEIWAGRGYVLDNASVFAIVLNFYLTCVSNQNWIFRETSGLFRQVRIPMLFAAGINLILSVFLGLKIGLAGILLATAIGKVVTLVWYEPNILYRELFSRPVSEYWKRQLKYSIQAAGTIAVGLFLAQFLPPAVTFWRILLGFLIALTITLAVFSTVNIRNKDFLFLLSYAASAKKIFFYKYEQRHSQSVCKKDHE